MRAGIHVANFTWQGGPAEMGPRLAELAVVSEEIGCPELLIGGRGERKTLRLVARYADACNLTSDTAEEIRHKFAVLRGHCETEGADYDAIEKTVAWTGPSLDSEDERARFLDRMAEFPAEGVTTVTITPYSDDPAAETKRWEPLIQRLADL